MSSPFKIAFELAGKLNSSFSATFMSASKKMQDINKNVNKLNNTKLDIDKFKALAPALSKSQQELIQTQKKLGSLSTQLQNSSNKTIEFEEKVNKSTKRVKELSASVKTEKEVLERLKSSLKETGDEDGRLSGSINKTKSNIKQLSLELKGERNDLQNLKKSLKESKDETKNFGREFQQAKDNARKLKSEILTQQQTLQTLRSSLKNAGVSTRDLSSDNAKLTAKLKEATKAQEKLIKAQERTSKIKKAKELNDSNRSKYRGQMVDVVATTATLAAPVKAAMNFESAMADVRKVVDFDTPKQFKETEKDILSLTRKLPIVAYGLADIYAAGGQSGIARKDLLSFTQDAAKMGVAFDISADQAGQTMAEWRTSFKLNQKEVVDLADKVNYLGNVTAASAPKVTEVVTRIGAFGEIGGASSGQVAALGATITSMGVQEEIAATGIKNFIKTLTAGPAATKSTREALKMVGLDSNQLARDMQKDSEGTMIKVLENINKIPKHAQASLLTEIFGSESLGAIAPLLNNTEELRKNFERVGDSSKYAGSMQGEFDARSQTTANSIQLFKNGINEIGINIGNIFLPPLAEGAQKLAEITSKVSDFMEKHPQLANTIAIVGGSILGFIITMNTLKYTYSIVKGGVLDFIGGINKLRNSTILANAASKGLALGQSILKGALSGVKWLVAVARLGIYKGAMLAASLATKIVTGAQWLLNAAMSANPIAIVVGLVAGLVAILVVLYNKCEPVREVMNSMWNGILSGAETCINKVIELLNWLIEKLNSIKIPDWVPGIGGKGINIEQIQKVDFSSYKVNTPAKNTGKSGVVPNKRAKGGIVRNPELTWVGEGGNTEVIIPINSSQRSLGLLQQAGSMLGAANYLKGPDDGVKGPNLIGKTSSLSIKAKNLIKNHSNNTSESLIDRAGAMYQSSNFNSKYRDIIVHQGSPQITIYGADEGSYNKASNILKNNNDDLIARLRKIKGEEKRLSYGW